MNIDEKHENLSFLYSLELSITVNILVSLIIMGE